MRLRILAQSTFVTGLVLACLLALPSAGIAGPWQRLMDRLVADGYDKREVTALFSRLGDAGYSSDAMGRKLRALYVRKYPPKRTAQQPKKPASGPKKPRVYDHCLVPERVREAKAFLYGNHFLLNRFVDRWAIPREVAVAILSVETRLGRILGKRPAVATLASMAATDRWEQVAVHLKDKPLNSSRRAWLKKRQKSKSDWAYQELTALLDHARDNEHDLLSLPGSPYGAIGMCQFMPSNAVRFGVDGNGDGRVDLFSRSDALHSMGRFLQANGWKGSMNQKAIRKVLYRYNHSPTYINTVLALAKQLRKGDS